MARDLSELSDDELTELDAKLASDKAAIRGRQNEVQAERELRQALGLMSDSTRRIVALRLTGSASPMGEAKGNQA